MHKKNQMSKEKIFAKEIGLRIDKEMLEEIETYMLKNRLCAKED